MSKTAMVAVLATSALTPVIASAAESTVELKLDKVVIKSGDNLVSLDATTFSQAIRAGKITANQLAYVQDNQGNIYDKDQYAQALRYASLNQSEAFKALLDNDAKQDVTPVEGTINVDGTIELDPTPEENLNETFFNNLAA